jgi:UDP-N-acetylglucosamine--N-acetylmuramyl-(pentapeptide) pyrophosphoryl-undecaprenol N-acetylglucosamine transferase
MAAGTGGHVFPALSIARSLMRRSVRVEWLGTPHGMENEILADTGITLNRVTVKGLRGTGLRRKLSAPFMLAAALMQSLRVIKRVQPDCVLGMGGFVCGPAGVACKLLGKPLIIHEQNAVAGLTNRLLARVADRVLEAFPDTFKQGNKVFYTGNPLRDEIIALHQQDRIQRNSREPLRILVLGGSQGATAINQLIPAVLAAWGEEQQPEVYHQAGATNLEQTRQYYKQHDVKLTDHCRVVAFIDDMAAAYQWADLVLCRSGASTVSEIAAAGLPAILVPYPYHKDKQQLLNARWLARGEAAIIIEQQRLDQQQLLIRLRQLNSDRYQLDVMSQNAKALAICDAAETITGQCMEVMHA